MDRRWEYRIWTKTVLPALGQIRSMGRKEAGESRTDTYLLPDAPDILPKLRGGERFEVKRLLDMREGLEEWSLEVSAGFPLAPDLVTPHLPHIDTAACASADDLTYRAAIEGFLVFPVQKKRELFMMDGVQAEITEVTVAGLAPLTIGLEGASFEDTRRIAMELGLLDSPNTNYGKAIRASHQIRYEERARVP